MGDTLHLNQENFAAAIAGKVALVDFWAEWCGPCRMLGPVIDAVAKEVGDDVVVGKVNVDEAPQLAAKFGVRSIPAIFVIKDGDIVSQFVGVQDKQTLLGAIKDA
ncbi:MAG: thioredoxin [Victivallales bacterium]|nr:thioredoxin [Victivallales bacterium]